MDGDIGSSIISNGFSVGKKMNDGGFPKQSKEDIYIRLSRGKSISELNKVREQRCRAALVATLMRLISGSKEEKDLSMLARYVVRANKDLFNPALNLDGQVKIKPLTVFEAVELQGQLKMSTASFRRIRRMLSNFGAPILPSEPKIKTI